MRTIVVVICFALAGCTGGGDGGLGAATTAAAGPAGPVASTGLVFEPQMPALQGELVGMPGTPAPGLGASYVTTGPGWLGPDGDVIFEGIIRWHSNLEIGCGIFRQAPDGTVNIVLIQGQSLAGTGGGHVRHPSLPLHASGDTLVLTALVEGGTVEHGLFAVPKEGGDPVLVLSTPTGVITSAVITESGTVVAEVREPAGSSVVKVDPGQAPVTLCDACESGFTTDGRSVLVELGGGAWQIDLDDGSSVPLVLPGDPAPGQSGTVLSVLDARITPNGDVHVLLQTDDPAHREVLVRIDDAVEVLAACGAPAPGLPGSVIESIYPAHGRGDDAVFGASLSGDPVIEAAVFLAPPAQPAQPVAATGEISVELQALLDVMEAETLSGAGGYSVYAATIHKNGVQAAEGIFRRDPSGAIKLMATTDARVNVPGEDATVIRFGDPLARTLDVAADGRVLTMVGVRLDRHPTATYWALYVGR